MEAALVGGKIDAASVHEPFATASVEKGVTRVLAHPWGEAAPKFLIASWFASEKWIQKNKREVEAFVRAINRGTDAIRADPEGTRKSMVKWAGLSPELAGKIGLPLFEKTLSLADLQVTIDLSRKYKLIPRALKAQDVVSTVAPKA
jgi:NitT/TauT family transport system substrate-binding protein